VKIHAASLVAFALFLPLQATAEQRPDFVLPVDCAIGKECFIQNYVDLAPGPDVQDHACGKLSYDGHKGTDIRVTDLTVLQRGIPVTAAADGRVKATRDGMKDIDVRTGGMEAIRDMECGNGVILDHGGGWLTKYCHMRRGSVLTANGSIVKVGQRLGLMGLSGKTAFPHLHFEILRDNKFVDPFTSLHQRDPATCSKENEKVSLWQKETAAAFKYIPSGVIRSGFATRKPDIKAIENGGFNDMWASVRVPVLLFWVQMYGMHTGDRTEFVIFRPDGSELARTRDVHKDRHKAQWYSFVGKRRPQSGQWPAGRYIGKYRLTRQDADGTWQQIISIEREFSLLDR